jgi:tripartite-type tricarboxylate transporter receptor subunit TctC
VSVPYKGAGPSFADLVSGQIQMIVVNVISQVLDFHAAQKIRLLAVNSAARINSALDIRHHREDGIAATAPATSGTNRTSRGVRSAVAMGSKADNICFN